MTLQELIVVVGADVGGFVDGMDSAISKANATESTLTSVGAAIPAALVQPLAAVADAADKAGSSFGGMDAALEALAKDHPDLASAVSGGTAAIKQEGDAATKAVSDLGGLDEAIKKIKGDAPALADGLNQTGQATQGFSLNIGSLVKSFAAFAGVQLTLQGLKAAVEEAFASFAQLQRATESLTALTGSAKLANDAIAQMRTLAQDEALSFPSLLKAAQQMAAFGISTKQSTALLAAAGDASRATGRDFDAVSSSVQRIVESGAAMGRTLQGIGLTTADLGAVMGVTAGEASKLFKSLDESTRVDIITAALAKFKGLAGDTANDLTGSWQQLSNAAQAEFSRIGQELSGTGQSFTTFAKTAIGALGSVADFAITFGSGIAKTFGDIKNSLQNAAAGWGVSLEDYAAAANKAADSNKNLAQSTGTLIIAARQLFSAFPDYSSQLSTLVKEFQNGVTDTSTFTTKVLALEGQFKSLHPTIGATATATGTYTQEVAKLKQQLADGDITQAKYNAQLKALEAQHGATAKAVKDHVLSLSDLTAKEASLTADAQKAIAVFTNVRAAYDQGTASAGLLAAAHDQMTKALKAAKEGFSELSLTVIQSLKDQGAAFDAWQKGYGAAALVLMKNQNDLQKAANDAAIAFNELARNALTDANAYNALGPALKVVEDAMKKAGMSGNDLDVTLTKIGGNQGIPVITGGVTKISDAFGKIDPVIKDVNDRIAALGQTTTGAVAVMQGGTTKMVQLFSDVKKAVDDVNVDVEDLGASIPTMTGKFAEGLFTVTDGLSNVIKSTNNVNDNFKLTTESGTVEFGKVAASVDGVAASAGKATSSIINMKGGALAAASAHQGLNDVAARLPEILNVDASTMERINSLVIQAGQATQQWGTYMESVAAAAKSSAEGFASFEQAAEDRMAANAKGGTFIDGAHYAPGGVTQATGSAGAEGGDRIIVNAPGSQGTIGGGEPPSGMKWNANHTGFIPDVTWINGVPYATGSAPTGTTGPSGNSARTGAVLDSGMVQDVNTRIRQMFDDMATAGTVDVAALNQLASTIGEFVTVDASGLHIAWQNASTAATTTATQIQAAATGTATSFAQLAGSAGTVNLGLSGISSTLQAFPSAVASIGPFADALDAATAIINAHVDALKTLQSQIDAANQANATAMAANLPGVRAYSTAPAHLSADELAMLNGQAPRVGIPNGTQFLIPSFPSPQAFVPASGSLHSGDTVNIYNPTVTNRSMLDDLAQQVADVLAR